jgi:hypothetical protein
MKGSAMLKQEIFNYIGFFCLGIVVYHLLLQI